MILLDTSAWIDLFRRTKKFVLTQDQLLTIATCPPIIQELLQGVSDEPYLTKLRDGLLALPCLEPMVSTNSYLEAADIYRSGRRKGFSIRSSYDCLIAAIAIKHQIPVCHRDRDFDHIAKFTNLQISNLK